MLVKNWQITDTLDSRILMIVQLEYINHLPFHKQGHRQHLSWSEPYQAHMITLGYAAIQKSRLPCTIINIINTLFEVFYLRKESRCLHEICHGSIVIHGLTIYVHQLFNIDM